MSKVAVNVVTGFLGAGKTTIIRNLISQLPDASKIVWLKNEYGDANVDSALMANSDIKVAEIMNGCLCCVLVGRLGSAINQIVETYNPERIIIESSGTAYPLPIVLELQKNENVFVDSVSTVIDCLNFAGYKDVGHVASMQANATDFYLLNKLELVSQDKIDEVKDLISDVHPNAVFILAKEGKVMSDLIFATDIRINNVSFSQEEGENEHHHHPDDVEVIEIIPRDSLIPSDLDEILKKYLHMGLIRCKGILVYQDSVHFYNWVLGRSSLDRLSSKNSNSENDSVSDDNNANPNNFISENNARPGKILVCMGQDLTSFGNQLKKDLE